MGLGKVFFSGGMVGFQRSRPIRRHPRGPLMFEGERERLMYYKLLPLHSDGFGFCGRYSRPAWTRDWNCPRQSQFPSLVLSSLFTWYPRVPNWRILRSLGTRRGTDLEGEPDELRHVGLVALVDPASNATCRRLPRNGSGTSSVD